MVNILCKDFERTLFFKTYLVFDFRKVLFLEWVGCDS